MRLMLESFHTMQWANLMWKRPVQTCKMYLPPPRVLETRDFMCTAETFTPNGKSFHDTEKFPLRHFMAARLDFARISKSFQDTGEFLCTRETLSKVNAQRIHLFLLYIDRFMYNEVGTRKFPMYHEFPMSMEISQLNLKKVSRTRRSFRNATS